MKLLPRPNTRFISQGIVIGFILNGDGEDVHLVIGLHIDDIIGQVIGVVLIAGREKIAAVDRAGILVLRRRTPWGTPYFGAAGLRQLHDEIVWRGIIGRD